MVFFFTTRCSVAAPALRRTLLAPLLLLFCVLPLDTPLWSALPAIASSDFDDASSGPTRTVPLPSPIAYPLLSDALSTAASATTAAVSVSAAVASSAGAATALQGGRAFAVFRLAECGRRALGSEPPFPQSLVPPASIGDSAAGYDRGTVAANIAAIIAVFAGASAAWAVAAFVVAPRFPRFGRVGGDDPTALEAPLVAIRNTSDLKDSIVGAADPEANSPGLRACRVMRYPSAALLLPTALGLDGVVGASTSLIVNGARGTSTYHSLDVILGGVIVIGVFGLCGILFIITLWSVPRHATLSCRPDDMCSSDAVDARPSLVERLRLLRDGTHSWVPAAIGGDASIRIVAMWHCLFSPYGRGVRWHLAVDMAASALVGVAWGTRPTTIEGCRVALWFVVAVTASVGAALCVLRPYLTPLRNAVFIVSALLTALAALIAAVSLEVDGDAQEALVDAAGALSLASAVSLVAVPLIAAWRFVDRCCRARHGSDAEATSPDSPLRGAERCVWPSCDAPLVSVLPAGPHCAGPPAMRHVVDPFDDDDIL